MLRINLLKSGGLQTPETPIDLPAYEAEFEGKIRPEPLAEDTAQQISELEQEIKEKGKTDKKKSRKKGSVLKPIITVLIILIISASIIYIYNYTDWMERAVTKSTKLVQRFQGEKPAQPVPINSAVRQNVPTVSTPVAAKISARTVQLKLISEVLELIPDHSKIYDFNIKNKNLSVICLVKDITSGENLKYYIYNHKQSFDPELFYIEQTETKREYQVTSLSKLLPAEPIGQEYKYKDDRHLAGSINSLASNTGITIEPLTITKRDQSVERKAYLYFSGRKKDIVNFFRKLDFMNANLSYDELKIKQSELDLNRLDVELGITIFPQQ